MSRAFRQKYIAAFKEADKNGNGQVSKEELRGVLDNLGKHNVDVERAFKRVDTDESGVIDQTEFLIFMEDCDNAWVRVQQKTFTRWANTVLSNRMLKLESISTDLRNGVLLAPLIEILSKSGKKVGKISQNPRMRLHKLENLNKSMTFLKNDGIKLVNVGADDIEEGNLKITLGLIWMLILKYQIGDSLSEGSPKWALLQWVKKQCEPYGIGQDLKNFKTGWSDGKVLSALTDSLGDKMNDTIDTNALSGDAYDDSKIAMDTAEEQFEIPKLMDSEDIVENPDEHSIMTYVAYFRDWADNMKNRASPNNTTAHGPGVEGGDALKDSTDFTVVCKNSQGKQVPAGGDAVMVKVTGPNGEDIPCELKDNEDGTYGGSYPVDKPGDYKVDVTLRGDPIVGSQFTAGMRAGEPGNCYAEGEGLKKGKTNRPCEFTIFSVDKDGKKVPVGGDPFEVTITGPSGPCQVDMKDNGDGTYPVAYAPEEEGDYEINVTLFGEPIKDAPFTASIKRAPNAAKSYVEGPGLKRAYDNKPTHFNVHAVDDVGKPVWGDDVKVTMTPEDENSELKEVEVAVVDNGDGVYRCDYAAPEAGDFVIKVHIDGDPVQGTPVHLKVRKGADASKSGGAKFKVTIFARGKDGEQLTEGGIDWEVEITDSEGADTGVAVTTEDNGDGSYSASYKLSASEEPVDYQVSMQLGGSHIQGSPFKQSM